MLIYSNQPQMGDVFSMKKQLVVVVEFDRVKSVKYDFVWENDQI